MHELWIYLIAFFASVITLLGGFGLGTILTPVFVLLYDVKLAILMVAIVHILNNALKLFLFRTHVEYSIIKRFGLLSILGAVLGASLQVYLYSGVIKVMLGFVLILLGAGEFVPATWGVRLSRKVDVVGGFASGLLGGLVGNQGAIRSAYLLNYTISKEAFIATSTVIAMSIDATRIPIYLSSGAHLSGVPLVQLSIVILVALAGTVVGKQVLGRVSLHLFKKIVASLVIAMGFLFVIGLL